MLWVLVALCSPVSYGFANVLDNYLANRRFKGVWSLVFYGTLFNVVFLPFALISGNPGLPPLRLLPYFCIVGATQVLYLIPYYKALKDDDTSIVSSLFALGKVFVPLLAFILVGEVLTVPQYIGFAVIILGSGLLTLHSKKKKFRLDAAFFYMLGCSTLLAIEAVVYKYIFDNVAWNTGFVWTTLIAFVFSLVFLFFRKPRKSILGELRKFDKTLLLFAAQSLFTFIGDATVTYAISLGPVTLVEGIDALQPLFVLGYALLFAKIAPRLFKEKTDAHSVFKKAVVFMIMAAGVVLVVK